IKEIARDLFTKKLERGRFIWPSLADGVVSISQAQMSYLLSGIDWRNPRSPGVRRAWAESLPFEFGGEYDSIWLWTLAPPDLGAENAAGKTQTVRSFERKRPVRQPFPDNIERERVVLPAPTQCPCCRSARLSKLGESVTSTLEEIPRQFKVIETVAGELQLSRLRGDHAA